LINGGKLGADLMLLILKMAGNWKPTWCSLLKNGGKRGARPGAIDLKN
jgi:hypothetical protein